MTDSPLARLKDFRASWQDNGLIDEPSGLTTEDLDVLIAQLEGVQPESATTGVPPQVWR